MIFMSIQSIEKHFNVRLRSLVIVSITYWILVMGLWGIFAFSRGLNYETNFPLVCQKTLYDCLIYGDNLRPYNSLFLGFAQLLSNGSGSYVSYQLLYGFIWWARGILVFLIFQKLFPNYSIFGFIIGSLAIAHISDGAVNWIGQIHQLGFLSFLALAVYALLKSWYSKANSIAFLWLSISLIALHISLWTYESQYFIALTVPLILLVAHSKFDFRFFSFSAAWYSLALIYGFLQLQRYIFDKSATYQTSIARTDLNLSAIFHDLVLHLYQSLQFWKWGTATPGYSTAPLAPIVGALCAIAFIIGAYLFSQSGFHTLKLPQEKPLLITLGFGILILILSFPIYLLLAGNTNFWRTQMLACFGTAIVFGSSLSLGTKILIKKRYQALIAVILCSIIIFFGVRAGVILQGFHGYRWQIHRNLMMQISNIAPDVKDHSLILLINVPKDYENDPFGASIWFDVPIQLLYPGTQVAGHFFYSDGTQPTDVKWEFTRDGLKQIKPGYPKQFDAATCDQVLALKYGENGRISVLDKLPENLLPPQACSQIYSPTKRIEPVLPKEHSIRMFSR